jgi:hypothetical protein
MIYWAEIDDLTGWLVKVVSKKDKNYSLYLVVQEVRLQKLNVDKYWLIGNAYFNERLAIFNAKRPVLNHTIYSENYDIYPIRKIFESTEKLSWQVETNEFYELERLLNNKHYSYHLEGNTFIIDHEGYVYLPFLTSLPNNVQFNNRGYVYLASLLSLPDNIQFNNRGDVDLDSLTSLPDNIQFNNRGNVYLNSLTSLPNNVQFNNRGNVNLYSLTSLPNNKYDIFKNDRVVFYNHHNSQFNPKDREKLSWQEISEDLIGWMVEDQINNDLLRYGIIVKQHNKVEVDIIWGFSKEDVLEVVKNYFLDAIPRKSRTTYYIHILDNIVLMYDTGLRPIKNLKIADQLPKAEEINQYDPGPETLLNQYPSKRKDNWDYKKRNTKSDEEMVFEKGLHQDVNRPETGRELIPYASKLSWQVETNEFYELERLLNNKHYSYHLEGNTFIIDHEGYVYLPFLTSLPNNVQFNNRGNVYLDSLTSLPNNVQFNNRGYVYLYYLTSLPNNIQFNNEGFVNLASLLSLPDNIQFNNRGYVYLPFLTSLPDNIQFNNRGYVYLDSLTSLPNNKYDIFKNDGVISYNHRNSQFNPKDRKKLSWQENKILTGNQTYDVVDNQTEQIEDRNCSNPLSDVQLKRRPPRFDKRRDWANEMGEKAKDSEISYRDNQTSLTSGASWRQIFSWQAVNSNTLNFISKLPEGEGYTYSVKFKDSADYCYWPTVNSKEEIINKIEEIDLDKILVSIVVYPDGSYLGRHWEYQYK